ncbi:MAG: NAD-dependent epimerase/dehydratase family protein [Acidimicrobiaceae bacterium]|nr:NAD-dependent epimerase/dehydratase family protein [Acidimicrobiaceae bacterium]
MPRYLVVGAGTIGSLVAQRLVEDGDSVTLVSRRGHKPAHPDIKAIAADAANAPEMMRIAQGTDTIINCANPAYHRWPVDWPPIASSLLDAARGTGSSLVTLSNLYSYGKQDGPMSPESPLNARYEKALVRAQMWEEALGAHRAGLVRTTEVRASDFIGPHSQGVFAERVIPRILESKSCRLIGDLDQLHSWTYVVDVASTLVTCARSNEAWGKVWHVPTNPPRTQRQVVNDLAETAGTDHIRISTIPLSALRLMGLFNPIIRELPKTLYQFTGSFIIDDSATRNQFGLAPTPWASVLRETIDSYRSSR